MLKVYFKPTCSTCKTALDIIHENSNDELELVEYLVAVPSPEELKEIISMIGIEPEDLVRKKEPLYQSEYAGKNISGDEWIRIMTQHPELIERPIIVDGERAIIGRPVEKIVEFLKLSSEQHSIQNKNEPKHDS